MTRRHPHSLTRKIATAAVLISLSATLSGCSEGDLHSPVEVASGGYKVQTAIGSYEKFKAAKTSSIYEYNNGRSHPGDLSSAGYTEQDASAGQRFVADYMVEEFIDSSALEGGDEEYQQWRATTAKNYLADDFRQQDSVVTGSGKIVLGSYTNRIPVHLINDGHHREKSLDMKLSDVGTYKDSKGTSSGIEYKFEYRVEYRVDDTNAAEYAARPFGMTGKEFLISAHAQDKVKDGTGENIYVAKGKATVAIDKDADGNWKIIDLTSKTEYDHSDWTQFYPKFEDDEDYEPSPGTS